MIVQHIYYYIFIIFMYNINFASIKNDMKMTQNDIKINYFLFFFIL